MCMKKEGRPVIKKFFELKTMKYRDGMKIKRQNGDNYLHVMWLDNSNSQAALACVHLPHHHTATYVKQVILYVDWLVLL